MAETPTSCYSSSPSPSPSPSPSTHIPAEWETRSQWRFCPIGEDTYNPLYRTPSPPTTQSRPKWNKAFASTGGRMHYNVDSFGSPNTSTTSTDDEMPDLVAPPTPILTDDEADDTHRGISSPRMIQLLSHINLGGSVWGKAPPHLSSQETQNKKNVALSWMRVAIEFRKSPVVEILRTGFNLNPSLEEVLEIGTELTAEFNQVMKRLIDIGVYYRSSQANLCFVNFIRDMMEIPNLAMIRMRKILAECKCCAKHQSRRPLCQEKKRQPGYDIDDGNYSEDGCKCLCRHLTRKLEEALLGEYPLKVNGQLWERSL